MSTTDGWLKLDFATCVIHQTRSLGALVLCSICNMVFVNYIYDMVVDCSVPQVLWYAVRAYSIFIPHEIYRSVTPLDATRVNRTILQGRYRP